MFLEALLGSNLAFHNSCVAGSQHPQNNWRREIFATLSMHGAVASVLGAFVITARKKTALDFRRSQGLSNRACDLVFLEPHSTWLMNSCSDNIL